MQMSTCKFLMGIVLAFVVSEGMFLFAEETALTLYVTRHAQRGPRTQWPEADREKTVIGEMIDGKIVRVNENTITPLGEKQCQLLGQYLKKLEFNGKVYASPTFRTMQTAVCTIREIDPSMKVIPEPCLQEGGNRKAPAKRISIAELMKRFPGNVQEVELPELWLYANETTREQWNVRMEKFLESLLKKEPVGKVLLVGHSSTLPSLFIAINKRMTDKRLTIQHYPQYVVNCCLYVYKFNKEGKVIDATLENWNYLPEDMQTLNFSPLKKVVPWKKNRYVGK